MDEAHTDAPAATSEAPRVLRRSRDDRVVGGVAGGLGRYFGIDPVLLRIAFVLLLLAGGSGILLYLIAWVVIPQERPGDAVGPPAERGAPAAGADVLGVVLVVAGVFLLLRVVFPDVFAGRYFWPVAVIALGLALVAHSSRRPAR